MRRPNIRSLLTVLIAAIINGSALLTMNPFGIAYFAGAYMYENGRWMLILATLGGMAVFLPIKVAVRYAGSMLGIVVVEKILKKNHRNIPVWVMAMCAGVFVMLAGIAYSTGFYGYTQENLKNILLINALEGLAVSCLVIIFHKAVGVFLLKDTRETLDNQEQLSTAILLAVCIYALHEAGMSGYSIPETFTFFALLYIGYRYGCGAAAISGAGMGIVLAVLNNYPGMIGYMCMIGIIAGAFRDYGRIVSMMAMALTAAACYYLKIPYLNQLETLRGIAAGGMAFLLMPPKYMVRTQFHEYKEKKISPMPDEVRQKFKTFAQTFKNLSNTFCESVRPRTKLSDEEVGQAFDELTQNVCSVCSRCEYCWEREYDDTSHATGDILDYCARYGTVDTKYVPVAFKHRCINLGQFLSETTRVIELARVNLIWQNRVIESRLAIAGQFLEVADIIDDFCETFDEPVIENQTDAELIRKRLAHRKMYATRVRVVKKTGMPVTVYITGRMRHGRYMTSGEICSLLKDVLHKAFVPGKGCRMVVSKNNKTYEFVEKPCFEVIDGVAGCVKGKEQVSGDTSTVMRLEHGQVLMSLSDGMGSGKLAGEESNYVIGLMEALFDTGFNKGAAVRLVNSLMFLRSDRQAFSTLDAAVINCYKGTCDMMKAGAASSYIRRKSGAVEEIISHSLPAGAFTAADYDSVTKTLSDGDMVIMLSDGVANSRRFAAEFGDGQGGKKLKDYIETLPEMNPQEMADDILNYARADTIEQSDDMTVLVCGLYVQ